MLISITFILEEKEEKKKKTKTGKRKPNPQKACWATFLFLNSREVLTEMKASCSSDDLNSAVAEATSCGHKQVQELPPLHGRRKWANTETNSVQEAAKWIQTGTCWIFYSLKCFSLLWSLLKNLPWVERAWVWHCLYLVGSSAAHKFINFAILLVQNLCTQNLWEPEKYASDI